MIHTADSELQGAYRIRKVWSQPGAALPGYDQVAWAKVVAYQKRGEATERESALAVLDALRRHVTPLFRRATDADWAKTGAHPEYGELTLRNLLELYADHTERHIAQILEIRAMIGQPLDLPLMLEQRLY